MLMIAAGLASIVYGVMQAVENSDASAAQMRRDFRRNSEAILSGGRPTFPRFEETEQKPHRALFA